MLNYKRLWQKIYFRLTNYWPYMVKDGSNRVELSPKARRALEIESVLQRISMKDLASDLILKGISPKTLKLLNEEAKT